MDKRQVYDWDTRIHLLARGPGIAKGALFELPATQVDIAPTFLGLAGVPKPADMDGKSLLPHLVGNHKPLVRACANPRCHHWLLHTCAPCAYTEANRWLE